jgi:hypothetical protein
MWSHVIFFLSFLGILRISDNSCKRVLFLRFGLGLISQKRIFLCSWIYVIHVFIPLSNTWASFSRLWRNTDASLIAYNYIYFSNKAGFFFFFPFELRALHVLGRISTSWAIPPALFVLPIFHIGLCTMPW